MWFLDQADDERQSHRYVANDGWRTAYGGLPSDGSGQPLVPLVIIE
jgi:hypothetical protein